MVAAAEMGKGDNLRTVFTTLYREYNALQEKQSPSFPPPNKPEVKLLFQAEASSSESSFLLLEHKCHSL